MEQPNAIVVAAGWVEQTMLGSVATILATIAVAMVGVSMLSGAVSLRRGARVIVGCFILFAAPTISHALKALAAGDVTVSVGPNVANPALAVPATTPATEYFDPYAGPAVPET
ncbi:type IV secretory pathway VirB2 component (pilin) [Sphingomonas prati]|uniref:Type IV secretory pathway VirB2 component (Pilin) n=1 Tax=Sphingomonas prati TaxID=1843237 RepID=A0A7W9BVS8_9SPHN|nr:TrbC/VirB2 family protein [Sphingomonas prati]MBB5730961.1 type IV secretory pathway VirB2 component (pilin) [Sphingomonas prati]